MTKREIKDLKARMEAGLNNLLSRGVKVPYTRQGWALIAGVINDSFEASGLMPPTAHVPSLFLTKPQITQQLTLEISLDLPE